MSTLNLDSIKAKLDQERANPEDAAKMDAEIRAAKLSVKARALVDAVKAALKRHNVKSLTPEILDSDPEGLRLKAYKEAFPKLYAMVNDPRHSPAILFSMLNSLESVENEARTTHDASVVVGTVLVNSFVRPKLGMEPVPLPDLTSRPVHR